MLEWIEAYLSGRVAAVKHIFLELQNADAESLIEISYSPCKVSFSWPHLLLPARKKLPAGRAPSA